MYYFRMCKSNGSGELRLSGNEAPGEGPIKGCTYSCAIGNMYPALQAALIIGCLVSANIGYLAVLPLKIVNTSSTLALVKTRPGNG
jgi:hypothetical protein